MVSFLHTLSQTWPFLLLPLVFGAMTYRWGWTDGRLRLLKELRHDD